MESPLNLSYASVSSSCHGYLRLPSAPVGAATPKVLLIHGGGWNAMDTRSFDGVEQFFHELGFITFNAEYRLTTEAPWPACGDDCLKAGEFLWQGKDRSIACTAGRPIVVCGASAGGHLALMTGLRLPGSAVAAVISISGIADPVPDQQLWPERYDMLFPEGGLPSQAFPLDSIAADNPPVLLTHYLHDPVVPFASVSAYVRKAAQAHASVETYFYDLGRENQGHAIWVPNSEPHRLLPDIEQAIVAFLKPRLQVSSTTVKQG